MSGTKNFKKYGDFSETQMKRMNDDDITAAQLWRSTKLDGFTTFNPDGTQNSLNLMPRKNAVKLHDMALELVKTKEETLTETYGDAVPYRGKLIWAKGTVDEISYSEVMSEATAAMKNAVAQTGQLDDEFEYRYQTDGAKKEYLEATVGRLSEIEADMEVSLSQLAKGVVPQKYAHQFASLK